ncbi:hypothetical protein L2E82_31401 [Cichorium intybus]|uniref:Uncharacterized protein n=1 Tax=Cichorium intybus TaxID=13427 RepID=A0ACB9D335_CICIN|nr:hypothetical protein L2E82_31401 [Cichorium intybus]
MKAKWYYYILLGLIDIEENYLVVKAYQYTSLTSDMLLDCWSIPSVIILTCLLLKTKYKLKKLAGVAGLVLVIFSNVHAADRSQSGSNPIKGDLLVITGVHFMLGASVSILYEKTKIPPLMGSVSNTQTPGRKRVASGHVIEKTVERRQKRMIKNMEFAARSRARKHVWKRKMKDSRQSSRASEDRTIPLSVIAERTKLTIEDVEYHLMKSLSVSTYAVDVSTEAVFVLSDLMTHEKHCGDVK